MKRTTKTAILTTIISLLPVLLGLSLYHRLPEQLPTHWGLSGEIDGYSSRPLAVFGIPILMAALSLLVQFMLEQDPRKRNTPPILKTISCWVFPVLSFILVPITIFSAMGYQLPVSSIICLIVGILFITTGNYLPKSRQSYTVGIRLPWTLNSEENWNRTHRLAGRLWVLAGFLFIVNGFCTRWIHTNILLFIGIMILLFVPTVYSFMLYKKGI